MARDIAQDTLNVGNALASVRIDKMILNLAKGIAYGQYELDKVGVDITKMMGIPGTVSIGGQKLSMLEVGFLPSFYHFVDTILELKMEVNIREEDSKSTTRKSTDSGSTSFGMSTEMGTKVSGSVGYGPFSAEAETSFKMGMETKTTSAYSRSLDSTHAQKFSQDLSASSLMRTKLVPIPAPEVLVERIRILLDKLRKDAEDKEKELLKFALAAEFKNILDKAKDMTDEELAQLKTAFEGGLEVEAGKVEISKDKVTVKETSNSWSIACKVDGTDQEFHIERDKTTDGLKVFDKVEDTQKADATLMDNIKREVLEIKSDIGVS